MPRITKILHADDNGAVRFLMERAITQTRPEAQLTVVRDGLAAKKYLQTVTANDHLVAFFDFDMPGLNGLELLAWIRENSGLSRVETIFLSSSILEEHVARARRLGASGYFVKPMRGEQLRALVSALCDALEDEHYSGFINHPENQMLLK